MPSLWLNPLTPQGESLLTCSSFFLLDPSQGHRSRPDAFFPVPPSYVAIFLAALVVQEFFQFPVSFP